MLRKLFNEPKRVNEGQLLKAIEALKAYQTKLERLGPKGYPSKQQNHDSIPRMSLWAQGFLDALDELEESIYGASKFAGSVRADYVQEMREEELDDYRRYVYFYKNAIIRVFSLLDKLGYFLDELYGLNTSRIKSRFSYFTVLRQMHDRRIEMELEQRLYDLKNKYQEPLRRLRSQRNMEIHLFNAEMVDDMLRAKSTHHYDKRQQVENIAMQMEDLTTCFDVVCQTVEMVFRQAFRSVRS